MYSIASESPQNSGLQWFMYTTKFTSYTSGRSQLTKLLGGQSTLFVRLRVASSFSQEHFNQQVNVIIDLPPTRVAL